MKAHWFLRSVVVVCCLCITISVHSQSRKKRKKKKSSPSVTIQNDVIGHGFDIRTIDPLAWGTSSKGKKLLLGTSTKSAINITTPVTHGFVTNPYEFEKEILDSDSINRIYQGYNSAAYYQPFEKDGSDKLLFVYTKKKKSVYKSSLRNGHKKTLDSALVSDFSRLGRDITPEGFISRYGTHYADEVVYGGQFIKRTLIKVDDFIYSPYKKDEFQQKVVEDIIHSNTEQPDTDPYIHASIGNSFTIGGDEKASWLESWESTVTQNAQPVEVSLKSYTELFKNVHMPAVEDKAQKIHLLDSVIDIAMQTARKGLSPEIKSTYYKKYSLRFKQRLTRIVKKNMGRDTDNPNDYTGDIFFGGFSKDDAILNTKPLITYGGLRLETLITDEEVLLDRNAIITIKPEDLKRGYVSVWDDTKKLFKSKDRKTLRVAGPAHAKTVYKDALVQKVEKTVELETIDKDIYDVTYTLELIKDQGFLENPTTTYNYVLDTELVAAATTGDKELLKTLFRKNGNRGSTGIIKAIITNKQGDDVLNLVIDNGVIPTTADLDIAFDPDYFDREKALILLERGAKPKNNMIYKAVAYKNADVVYALFREGATPRNNDLAFALELYHYPTVKALMSEKYDAFVAGKNELLLAAENNDEDLAAQFIALGATADAYILDQATQFDNSSLRNVIVPVTEATGETLEVVAKINDTELFDYFVKKDAKIETNKAAELATDNENTDILDLALKNGGEPTEALEYAIEKENKPAIEVSLKNKAKPDAVFAYAAKKEDIQLFNDALTIYGGTPSIALKEAVKQDIVPLAQSVITKKRAEINPSETVELAVSNESMKMLKLLITNNADPNEGIYQAIRKENVPITEYLITNGAQTVNPEYLKTAVKSENLELSKLLVEKGTADVNTAIVDASITANVEITEYLLEKGATPDQALKESMETTNEDIILLLLDRSEHTDPSFISTAARKGNYQVVQKLLERGLNPNDGLIDAVHYKKENVLQLLLESGAKADQDLLQTAITYNFPQGVDLILSSGVDASSPFKDGQHALHLVATSYEASDIAMITRLLNAQAQINAKNRSGETPLHLAVLGGRNNLPLVEKLVNSGAHIYAENNDGDSVIDYVDDKNLKSYLKKALKAQRKTK